MLRRAAPATPRPPNRGQSIDAQAVLAQALGLLQVVKAQQVAAIIHANTLTRTLGRSPCVSQESLRRQLGIVPQEGFLFSGTIGENMAFGRPGATDEEIRAAARAVGADRFVAGLEHGCDTQVGERSTQLSAGQRQLVARRLLAGRTSIVIAHRLSTIRQAGRIVVLDGGRIVEQGTHDELLAAEGACWRLYRDWMEQAAA